MMGPWKNEEELLESMLYWQNETLESYNFLEMEADYIEDLIEEILKERDAFRQMELERDYYKQQFLDKQEELQKIESGKNLNGD